MTSMPSDDLDTVVAPRAGSVERGGEVPAAPPAVSVIVPAYKAAAFIGMTLDSVFSQTYADFEVIVVNDGSPDTEELERALEPYRRRVVYARQENLGAGAARNRALREARGHLVAFLDADDIWLPNFLEEQVRFLSEGGHDLVYCDALLFGDSPAAGLTYMQTASPSRGEVTFRSLVFWECNVITSGTLARREAIFDAGLFDESLRNSQDFELWVRMVRRGARIAYQRKVLLHYRCHGGSLSAGDLLDQALRQIRVYERIGEYPDLNEGERAVLSKMLESVRADMELEVGKRHLRAGDFVAARASFKRANRHRARWKLRAAIVLLRVAPRLLSSVYAARARPASKTKASAHR